MLFTIPLRRALVTHSDLPYPEGVAAAEVLGGFGRSRRREHGSRRSTRRPDRRRARGRGLRGLAIAATRVVAAEIFGVFRVAASAASGYNIAWSLALFGAGHLVGLAVGLAMLTGP